MGICCSYYFEKEIYEDIERQQGFDITLLLLGDRSICLV